MRQCHNISLKLSFFLPFWLQLFLPYQSPRYISISVCSKFMLHLHCSRLFLVRVMEVESQHKDYSSALDVFRVVKFRRTKFVVQCIIIDPKNNQVSLSPHNRPPYSRTSATKQGSWSFGINITLAETFLKIKGLLIENIEERQFLYPLKKSQRYAEATRWVGEGSMVGSAYFGTRVSLLSYQKGLLIISKVCYRPTALHNHLPSRKVC